MRELTASCGIGGGRLYATFDALAIIARGVNSAAGYSLAG